MYLWRFAIEHAFRFLKQHFGLNANQSTNPDSIHLWMRLCALAYWQLVLMRDEVEGDAIAGVLPGILAPDLKTLARLRQDKSSQARCAF